MASALSTTVSLTPQLAAEAWAVGSSDLVPRLHEPAALRLLAVRKHYNTPCHVNNMVYSERLLKATDDHEVSRHLSRTGVWQGFRKVYAVWQERVEQLNRQKLPASVIVKDLWGCVDDPEVTDAVRDAQPEEKELMRDMLWTMLHRTVGLE